MEGSIAFLMFAFVFVVLLTGYPVAITLAGTALAFAGIGMLTDTFDTSLLSALPSRLFGIMSNEMLMAVPLFVFMGVVLEKSKVAEQLLETMSQLFGKQRGGLGISVVLVGMLLAASTGIVGATVVTMGLLSLPTMLRRGYDSSLSAGTICAAGTLGQLIPPSIVLVLLGDVISTAYQQAQLNMGIYSPKAISVGDLFAGALLPGLLLVLLYILYLLGKGWLQPDLMPVPRETEEDSISAKERLVKIFSVLVPPLVLIFAVLGSILAGMATPTEAAAVGAVGAMALAVRNRHLNWKMLGEVTDDTLKVTSMVFLILIGASIFSLVFRGFGGDEAIHEFLSQLPGGVVGATLLVMVVLFLLGFILDFIEITFVVVPLVGPVLLAMGLDPVWLGVMIALNLQTSFLTPPFGFSLFYLRGVAPASVTTPQIYRGVVPFIVLQLVVMGILVFWPELATWLPTQIYGAH